MSLISKWRGFWFQPAPYFDLALLRVILVTLQCYLLLSGVLDSLIYTISLPDESYSPIALIQLLTLPWGWEARPSADAVLMIYWATLLLGALSLAGLFSNLSLFAFALGNLFLVGYKYSFQDFHHPEAIMMIALLALSLGPCGKVLSVDSLIRQRRQRTASAVSVPLLEYSSIYAWWSIRFLQCVFPLMYLSAVLGKLTRSGFEWANGYTLQYYMIQDYYRYGSELALWASRHHNLLHAGQVAILLFQATFYLCVFIPRLRWIYLPFGLIFHFGNYFTLRADFPQWILLYVIFIPWSRVFKWLATARVPAGAPA